MVTSSVSIFTILASYLKQRPAACRLCGRDDAGLGSSPSGPGRAGLAAPLVRAGRLASGCLSWGGRPVGHEKHYNSITKD